MRKILLTVIIFALLMSLAAPALAKDLEPCYHCDSTGKYHCINCNNEIWMVCDLCHGQKTFVCPGEEGKGPCDGGSYLCPSCGGDGYTRSGDGEIPPDAQPGSCGHCGGSGRLECWTCHWAGFVYCDRCGGAGGRDCDKDECLMARANDWKCPYCMGAGYMLTNFWPGENDGVQNAPVPGDKIWVNGKSTTYGGESPNPPVSSDPKPPINSDPQPPANNDPEPQINSDPEPPESDEREIGEVGGEGLAGARVDRSVMSEAEIEKYDSLSKDELWKIRGDLEAIVNSAEPQRSEPELDEMLDSLVRANGYSDRADARVLPIRFEGHLDLGFPVLVSVRLGKGVLDGGWELDVFHVTDGGIENLGKAEYYTYPDGSVEEIRFYTTGFSWFFTARHGFETELEPLPEPQNSEPESHPEPQPEPQNEPQPEPREAAETPVPVSEKPASLPVWALPTAFLSGAAIAALTAFIIVKKNKK